MVKWKKKVDIQNAEHTHVYEDKDRSVKGTTDMQSELYWKRQKCPANCLLGA